MNYQEPTSESEHPSPDDIRLRRVLRTLEPVDAPNDFDRRLKARIAARAVSPAAPLRAPFFRFALPALALLVFGVAVVYLGFFRPSGGAPETAAGPAPAASFAPPSAAASPAANAAPSADPSAVPVPVPSAVAAVSPAFVPKTTAAPASERRPPEPANRRAAPADERPRSEDKGVRGAPIINPPGFDRTTPAPTPSAERPAPIPVREVLTINGIDAALENGKWKVKAVIANSVGAGSGIRENDVIEAIDDQPIGGDTVFNRTVRGNYLIVTRGGERIRITLRNPR